MSGVAKLWDRPGFVGAVRGFALLPDIAVPAFAAGLPVAEILVSAALLSRAVFDWSVTAWAGLVAMGLFAMFGIAVAINMIRGRTDISCGCFGKSNRRLTWGLVGRALFFLAVSVLTLPDLHRGAPLIASVSDRLSAALVGAAVVAIAWLGRFIVTGGPVQFESRS